MVDQNKRPSFTIKRTPDNHLKFADAPIEVDIERSILDVRKVYSELSIDDFSKMYKRRFKVGNLVVKKILEEQQRILEERKEYSLLTDLEFVEMYTGKYKVKKKLVLMVLEDHIKETGK